MKDFWLSCGHHLLDRQEGGGLLVTDDFLKAYMARPELAPPSDACGAERRLHASLLADPLRHVSDEEIVTIDDVDAQENWVVMLGFRDLLLRHKTLEAAYLDLVRSGTRTAPLFLNQLVHVILRNALDGCEDAMLLRAAELFFRPQRMTLHDGALIAADDETINGLGNKPLSPLVSMLGLPAAAEIDVLRAENAATYWERSDRYDTAIDLTAGREGLVALANVIAVWTRHLLGVAVEVEPLREMQDVSFVWYVGLDVDGTKIGDRLWKGDEIDEATRSRVIGLFRMRFRDPDAVLEKVGNEPVYLISAMAADKTLRLKPQNLVTGLPIRHLEAIT